jgi:hypothetical protein
MPLGRSSSLPTYTTDSEQFIPRKHPGQSKQPVKVVRVKPKKTTNHYLYIKSDKYLNDTSISTLESSASSSGLYMTQYEREKVERAEKKKKFLHGGFKGYSGVASAMPLRKEGGVRVAGEYLPPIRPHHKEGNVPLYGDWLPTPSGAATGL